MKTVGVMSCVVATVIAALPVYAHHSGSMFEPTKTITLTGVVTEFEYTNPHSWLIMAVKNPDGTVTKWGFEAEGPGTLMRFGVRRSDFSPGTQVTITGHPMKDGRPASTWFKAVRVSDGKVFDLRPPGSDSPK